MKRSAMFDNWIGLLALYSVASLIETVFWGQLTAFMPLYLADLGLKPASIPLWTGLIASLTGLAGLPFLPLWGALADRYSRQPLIVRSFAAYILGGILAMLAHNVWLFIVGRSVMSLALGNSGLMMTTLAERTPSTRQGLAFSIMNSASPVGVFLGPLFGGPIVDRWGFRVLLGINMVLMVIVVLALSFGYRDTYRGGSRAPLFAMALDSVRVTFRASRLRQLFVALFLLFAGWMLALNYLPLVVGSLYTGDNPASAIGFVMGGGGLLALFLGPLFGALADRYGHWRTLMIGSSLLVGVWISLFLANHLILFSIVWAVTNGLASGAFSVSFSVLASSASPEIRGRVMSFAYLPVNLGVFIGPAIGSLVTRMSLFAIFPAAALFTLLSLFVLLSASRQPLLASEPQS